MPNPLAQRGCIVFEVLENLEGTYQIEVLCGREILEPTVEETSSATDPALCNSERDGVRFDADVLVMAGQEPADRSGTCTYVEHACRRLGQQVFDHVPAKPPGDRKRWYKPSPAHGSGFADSKEAPAEAASAAVATLERIQAYHTFSMSLKPTTVRFVPGEATSPDELAIAVLHLYAYETAKGLVSPGARVLDIGFGEGYGSEILSDAGAEYRGLEVDPEIVEHARARYGPRFETYDGSTIAASDKSFDLVVAFQMIAYLDDPLPLLREIRRVLDPSGIALLTTPNRVYRLYEGQRP